MNSYQKARDGLLKTIYDDLIGPESENEIIPEAPTTRYSAGVLFPKEKAEEQADSEVHAERSLQAGDDRPIDDEEAEGLIEQTSSFYPSAMGLSFIVDKHCKELKIDLSAGKYQRIQPADFPVSVPAPKASELPADEFFSGYISYSDGRLVLKKPIDPETRNRLLNLTEKGTLRDGLYRLSNLADQGWKRLPVNSVIKVNPLAEYSRHSIPDEHLAVVFTSKTDPGTDLLICTATVVNEETAVRQLDNEKSYYQIALKVSSDSGKPVFHPFRDKNYFEGSDPEEKSLQLLYRNKNFFATGHGTSASWKAGKNEGFATEVMTDHLPSYIIPQVDFGLKASEENYPDLSMRHFADDEKAMVINDLRGLHSLYEKWISAINKESETLPPHLKVPAEMHIRLCRESASRISRGIDLLNTNDRVLNCFRLANKAMLMQRVHSKEQEVKHFPDEHYAPDYNYNTNDHVWRPFQIAFLLLNIAGIADPSSGDRDLVDLIWFPTGGGKTEAYLALTAFVIFMRRTGTDNSGGTTVLMRYTLRLLTSQQFQRACTLICACEKLRRDGGMEGEQITIGQWLGSASSPNTLKDAGEKLDELLRQRDGSGKNPFQVLHCPWCGTHLVRKEGRGTFGYRIRTGPKRFEIWCPNEHCDFHDGLPLKIVDEDIYREPPTLLFGTVDKFAMLAWKADASSIFALNQGNNNLSPELIIQDELHLISGSLGTMVGLYETAIDLLCSRKGLKPKIIASTATIRRSKDQCRSLYAREVRQFPAPGLNSEDSFFAKESEISKITPGRLYVGVMPSGKTSTTMQVRLLADSIQGVELLEADDNVKDKYWTQVVYCNSIRELGTSKSIIYDDVKEYSKRLSDRLGVKPRYYSDKAVEELTSRIPAETIPEILQKLEIKYPSREAIDVLLATNMISVGVDINRLGLMMVLGQPKTTSEYIQASSRVGRSYPGLVVTLYSPVKSRDRSHFEQFIKYHQALYRYVEPTSVTPFSSPVRNKALHAVLIILIRHMLGYATNDSLAKFDADSAEMQELIQKILARISVVDPAEIETAGADISTLVDRIKELQQLETGISYDNIRNSEKIPLLRRPGDKTKGIYATPQSLRNTDAECYVSMDYS